MEQIISALEKIRTIAGNTAGYSAIEKDLMLQYTRDLYAIILTLEEKPATISVQELTEEPEPLPEAIIEEATGPITAEAEEIQAAEETLIPEVQELQAASEEPEELEGEQNTAEESRVEEPGVLDEPDRSELYTDLAVPTEEGPSSHMLSFELEPELKGEETAAPYQARHSTDFRIWNKDIRSYIGINDKYNFISELFKGNSEAYDEILTEINQCDNKQDALRFLENAGITTLYHWKEDGFSEQIFYNVLSQFFAAR